jgi:hypothetical protein
MFNDTDWRATTAGINFSVLVTALPTENLGDVSQLVRTKLRSGCEKSLIFSSTSLIFSVGFSFVIDSFQ